MMQNNSNNEHVVSLNIVRYKKLMCLWENYIQLRYEVCASIHEQRF